VNISHHFHRPGDDASGRDCMGVAGKSGIFILPFSVPRCGNIRRFGVGESSGRSRDDGSSAVRDAALSASLGPRRCQ